MFTLTFTEEITYPADEQGINLDLVLSTDDDNFLSVTAKLDTGSTFCIFQRKYAEALGLTVERGMQESVRTAKGSFTTYGHTLNIKFCDLEWTTTVYFAQDESFPINVVGRVGFLNFLKIGLIDYDQTLYLSSYNE